jgi:uncharacterized paraquat-inducible protein A
MGIRTRPFLDGKRSICSGGRRYTRPMPIHPEGEDQSTERVETVRCPHCHAQVPVPRLAPVNDFACPQCGEQIPVANKASR